MTTGKQDDTKGADAMPVGIASTDQLGRLAYALSRAYYYTDLGGWRGPEVEDGERWVAVAEAAAGMAPQPRLTHEQACALHTMLDHYGNDPRMRCLVELLPANMRHDFEA